VPPSVPTPAAPGVTQPVGRRCGRDSRAADAAGPLKLWQKRHGSASSLTENLYGEVRRNARRLRTSTTHSAAGLQSEFRDEALTTHFVARKSQAGFRPGMNPRPMDVLVSPPSGWRYRNRRGADAVVRGVRFLYSRESRRAFLTQWQDSQAHRLTLWLAREHWVST
jgi:hypothetical protein